MTCKCASSSCCRASGRCDGRLTPLLFSTSHSPSIPVHKESTHMTIRSAFMPAVALGATLAAATAAQAAPATYTIDPMHTFVTFEAKHYGTSTNRGRFDKKTGTIVLDKAAKSGKVDIAIDMASINTGTGSFDSHLKSKDFFNVDGFATATFTSDKLVFDGDKVTAVDGKLTLLGKTQPVTLKALNYGCYE